MNEPTYRPLSYSSICTLKECEQKFTHYRILNTEEDPDYERSTEAFTVGTTFHEALEEFEHEWSNKMDGVIARMLEEEGLLSKFPLVRSMVKKYCEFHKLSGMKVLHIELGLNSADFVGYVDVILQDAHGKWYICDLKTKSKSFWGDKQKALLLRDPQLSFYSKHIDQIASQLELDVKNFKGCLYRVATKPTLKQRAKEKDADYMQRLYESITIDEVFVPYEYMDTKAVWEVFEDSNERYKQLIAGEVPTKNFANCVTYNKPCPYFSNCHPSTYTESLKLLKERSHDSLTELEKVDI